MLIVKGFYLNKIYQFMQYSRASQPIADRIKLQTSNVRKIRTQAQQQTINPSFLTKPKAQRVYIDVYDMIKQEESEHHYRKQKRSRCNSFQPLLRTAQMKIFREISCLINDINQIQKQIQSQQASKDLINQKILQYIQDKEKNNHDQLRLHMREMLFDKKKDLPINSGITKTQLNQMEDQIRKMSENLEILELKSTNNLPAILQQQRNKLHALSSASQQTGTRTSKDDLTSMGKIQNFQHQLKSMALICKDYPQKISQIEYLELQAQKLKQQLLSYSTRSLRGSQQQAQRQRLQEYVQQQANNKIIFMQELTELQNQFQQLKKQNILLKQQLNIGN